MGVVTLREPAGQIGLPVNPSKAVVTMMTNAFLTPLSYSCLAEPSTKVRGIDLNALFADALYAFKSRGFGGEAGLVAAHTPLVP